MNRVQTDLKKALEFLTIPLIAAVGGSLTLMLLANEDPFARNFLCSAGVCFYSDAPAGWNKLIYDLSLGCATTVAFYWLLVRWPDHQKRHRIKKSFRAHYREFKLSCIGNFLAVADGGYNASLPEQLLPIEAFRDYFKEHVGEGKSRWDEVANRMTPYYLEATLSRFELLRQEISFLIHNTDISEAEAFEVLKKLSQAMLMQRNATVEYDDINSFLGLCWQLFAGWNWVEGYRSRDLVEDMINSI